MRDENGLVDSDYDPYETEQKKKKKQQLKEELEKILIVDVHTFIQVLITQ